jgi:hypothetical protein
MHTPHGRMNDTDTFKRKSEHLNRGSDPVNTGHFHAARDTVSFVAILVIDK